MDSTEKPLIGYTLIDSKTRNFDRLQLHQNEKTGRLVATLARFSAGRWVKISRQFDISRDEWQALKADYT